MSEPHHDPLWIAPHLAQAQSDSATPRARAEAFTHLYERFQSEILTYLRLHLPTLEDAEDCSQEVYLTTWTHIKEVHGPSSFRPWLYRIARNLTIDYWRGQKRRQKALQVEAIGWLTAEEDRLAPSDSSLAARVGCVDDIAAVVAARDDHEVLRRALRQLSPRLRECVLLHAYFGFSYEEIAEALHLSVGAVGRNVYDARAQLRTALEDVWHAAQRRITKEGA